MSGVCTAHTCFTTRWLFIINLGAPLQCYVYIYIYIVCICMYRQRSADAQKDIVSLYRTNLKRAHKIGNRVVTTVVCICGYALVLYC